MTEATSDQATPVYSPGDSEKHAFNTYWKRLCDQEGVRLLTAFATVVLDLILRSAVLPPHTPGRTEPNDHLCHVT